MDNQQNNNMNVIENNYINEYPTYNLNSTWDNIVSFLFSINKKEYMIIIVIFCLLFKIFNNSYIITIIMFSIMCIFFILYKQKINTVNAVKINTLYPKSKYVEKSPDIYNFLFSVQEFYDYNPNIYTNMIINLDKFLEIYNDVLIDNSFAGKYYDIINDLKYEILSLFQSFIFKLPDDNFVVRKYNDAKYKLEDILNKYTTHVFNINREYIKKNGINNTTDLLSKYKLKESYNVPFGDKYNILKNINKII